MSHKDLANPYGISVEALKGIVQQDLAEGLANLEKIGGILRLVELVETSETNGITANPVELERRKAALGTNTLPSEYHKSFLRLTWEAMQDTTLIILQVAAVVSLVLNFVEKSQSKEGNNSQSATNLEWIEGCSILGTVFVVVMITVLNDYSKDKQFRSLQRRIDQEEKVSVVRDKKSLEIPIVEVLVGDICKIKYGDVIPADGVLLQGHDLLLDESSLTGESEHVSKSETEDPMLLAGTYVMEGSGTIVITAVGIHSQLGVIMELMGSKGQPEGTEEKSLLNQKLTRLAMHIGYAGALAATVTSLVLMIYFSVQTFAIQKHKWDIAYAQTYVRFFIMGVTILVVAVPEGLPLAVTLSLAYSVKRMMKDNVLVRHLDSCETMGNATVICSDKTGTLTANKMVVASCYVCGNMRGVRRGEKLSYPAPVVHLIAQAISYNSATSSNINPSGNPIEPWKMEGNKTECAILAFVHQLGTDYHEIRKLIPEGEYVKVYPFTSDRKTMSTVIRNGEGYRIFVKGAAEVVLAMCSHIVQNEGTEEQLSAKARTKVLDTVVNGMATQGLRTLCLAYRDISAARAKECNWEKDYDLAKDLVCVCIVGIEDPLRPEVPPAIKLCQKAGIRVIMVTGDNPLTARSIALKCGILKPGDEYVVLDGKEFNKKIRDDTGKVKQDLIDNIWPNLKVLARSTPVDKHQLVSGIIDSEITKNREVVAVTGDGTNDGPALRRADVGFAMGIAGTAVAKEACDIIITDDNFSSIVKAVMWGRNVNDSIGKFIQFQLTVNMVAVVTTLVGASVIHRTPISVIQMLWVNLIMDTLASLSLATDSPTLALLNRKPHGRKTSLMSRIMLRNIFGQSIYQVTILLIIIFAGDSIFGFQLAWHTEDFIPTVHFTMVFNTMVIMTLFNEINARKLHNERNVFQGIFSNPFFYVTWSLCFVLQVIFIECGGNVLRTTPLPDDLWLWCFFFGISVLLWGQLICSFKISDVYDTEKELTPSDLHRGRILWVRGLSRLETQFKTLNVLSKGMATTSESHSLSSTEELTQAAHV